MSERPRKGDIVFAAMGRPFRVTERTMESVQCTSADENRVLHRKTFAIRDLECVDPDDGIWQEMIR